MALLRLSFILAFILEFYNPLLDLTVTFVLNSPIDYDPITLSDEEEAETLFQNMRNYNLTEEKARELAFRILETNPTEKEYYEYFINRFPSERRTLIEIAKYCGVDLNDFIDSIFSNLYKESPHSTEAETLVLYDRMKQLQEELGVETTPSIEKVKDLLQKFDIEARTYRSVTYATREMRAKAEKDYIILSEICKNIKTSDENECNRIKSEITDKGYLNGILYQFQEQIQLRLEEIWKAEDGKIFDNILINTDVTNADAIKKSIDYISSSGRTEAKKQYINALNGFSEKNITLAKKHAQYHKQSFFKKYGKQLISVILTYFLFNRLSDFTTIGDFLALLYVISLAWLIISLFKPHKMRKAWDLLTVNGSAIHPVLLETDNSESFNKQSTKKASEAKISTSSDIQKKN